MTDIVERLIMAAKSCRRQAASAVRMNGPTAIVGEVSQLDKAARLHEDAAAEIERLRLSLSEARATGKREGLSEAAKIANEAGDECDWIDGKIEAKTIAAAIRAAMEKEE